MDRLPKQIDNLAWLPTVPLSALVNGGAAVAGVPVYVARRGRDGETVYRLAVLRRSSEAWSTVQRGDDRITVRNEQVNVLLFCDGQPRLPERTTPANLPTEAQS